MKIVFDTNIVLDFLMDRTPFSDQASILFIHIEKGLLSGFLCATTITTVHYLSSKAIGVKKSRGCVSKLLTLFEIAPVNRIVLDSAINLGFKDFEDAVLHEAGFHAGVHGIVTRDSSGFKKAKLRIYSPSELINIIQETEATSDLNIS